MRSCWSNTCQDFSHPPPDCVKVLNWLRVTVLEIISEETPMNLRLNVFRVPLALILFLLLSCWPNSAAAQTTGEAMNAADKPFVVEYYYKAKWGYANEFLTLFKKNHYPLLQKQVEMGRMLKVSAMTPRYHGTEDGRWDYRITIVFKDATAANDGFDEKALIKQLYPDQDSYKKEEQRRFEILEAHWDLPIKELDLNQR
jgi:hypothetical protein